MFSREYQMKFKELLVPLTLALLTTWALQYFFSMRESAEVPKDAQQSGKRFAAPQKEEIQVRKPLNLEIDFLDAKPTRKPIVTSLETAKTRYEFTTDGAALARIEFKRNWGGKQGYLATVHPPSAVEKEKSSFLVALPEKTPFYFEFVDKKEEADRFILSYKTPIDGGMLFKTFTVFKNEYRIDLELSFDLKEGVADSIKPRIFFASPLVSELGSEDIISGIVNSDLNGITV